MKFLKIPVLCTDKFSKISPKMFGLEQACTEKVKICSDCPSGPKKCQICSDQQSGLEKTPNLFWIGSKITIFA